jgi:hypothetical protein
VDLKQPLFVCEQSANAAIADTLPLQNNWETSLGANVEISLEGMKYF